MFGPEAGFTIPESHLRERLGHSHGSKTLVSLTRLCPCQQYTFIQDSVHSVREFIQSFLSYLHILLLFKNAIILWLHQGINKFISGQRPHKLFVSGNTITDRYRGCEYSSRGLPIQLQITLGPTLVVRHSICLGKHIMAYVYIYSIIAKHFPHDPSIHLSFPLNHCQPLTFEYQHSFICGRMSWSWNHKIFSFYKVIIPPLRLFLVRRCLLHYRKSPLSFIIELVQTLWTRGRVLIQNK